MTEGRDPAPLATTPDAVAADVVAGMERSVPVVWSPGRLRLVFAVLRFLPAALWRRLPG
jgi:decaprenylphospho-beta-D-erythro-pentofuranosid-2-ulose 2-reductase